MSAGYELKCILRILTHQISGLFLIHFGRFNRRFLVLRVFFV
jgi:hypothetical protein